MTPGVLETIDYSVADGVATIRMNRPERLNAFSTTMYSELRGAIRVASADNDIDVIVVTGTGRAFATGGDLEEFLTYLNDRDDPLALYRFEDALPFEALRACPKVVIAAINGICMAGGLITAMSADISVAVRSAVFAAPEGRIGLAEAWMPNLMFGRVSMAKAKYLLLTGNQITAARAEEIGLITEVVDDQTALDARVSEIVGELRGTSPVARAIYKESANRLTPHAGATPLYQAAYTAEGVEGLSAFVEKRPPDYRALKGRPDDARD